MLHRAKELDRYDFDANGSPHGSESSYHSDAFYSQFHGIS
ncbi:MAG: hypothetical protein ACI8P2_000851 [Candidatus Latescibacterota bacterium]